MLQSNQIPSYTVDSAVRLSGPSGRSAASQLITNGDFSDLELLSAWKTNSFGVDTSAGAALVQSFFLHQSKLTAVQNYDL